MGWYRTCDICGESDKYRIPNCGCHQKLANDIMKSTVGKTILSTYSYDSYYDAETFLILEFDDFCVEILTNTTLNDEYKSMYTIKKITKIQFEEIKLLNIEKGLIKEE